MKMKIGILLMLLFIHLNLWGGQMDNGRDECETLMNVVAPLAEKLVLKNGGFHPYGGEMTNEGKSALVAVENGLAQPSSQK